MTTMGTAVQDETLRRYRPYPAYKDSGVEWLGDIPAHWDVKRLKYVAPLRITKLDIKPDDAVYVGLENVESWTGRLLLESQPESVDSIVGAFRAGDVLFGKLRPYLAKVARPDFDGVCTGEILSLRPAAGCTQSYVMYGLLNAPYIRWLDSFTYGTKMPRLSPSQVAGSFVSQPPLEEQRAIANFLDRETGRIDALVAKKQRLIQLLQEQRNALITRAVTMGLDPSVPMKDSGVEWLGEIPEHWEAERIKWVAKMESGHTPDKKTDAYWRNGSIPWVSLADTSQLRKVDYIGSTAVLTTPEGIANSSAHVLPSGTVVFSRDATIGLCAITQGEMAVSQHFIGWICGERICPEYLLLALRSMSEELERLTMGATVRTIGMPDVRCLAIPIPPLKEQQAIVDDALHSRAEIDKLVFKVKEVITRLRELRAALISAAVTGKIDVREVET